MWKKLTSLWNRITGVATPFGGLNWMPSDRLSGINAVVEQYLYIPLRDQKTFLMDFIRAGGALLPDSQAILEAADKIEMRDSSSSFIRNMRGRILDEEWLAFFQWYVRRPPRVADVQNQTKINEMLDEFKTYRNTPCRSRIIEKLPAAHCAR